MDISAIIQSVTRVTTPRLTPELSLRLVTKDSPWWRLTPADLEDQGIPEPFWAFAWSGGQALARYILDNPKLVQDKDVVDFGAGGGIVSLAARASGARSVIATEIDPWALVAYKMNVNEGLIDGSDWIGRKLAPGTILLCGDMSYAAELCEKLVAWFRTLNGVDIIIGDAGRGFIGEHDFEGLASYQAPADYDDEGRYFITASVLRFRS